MDVGIASTTVVVFFTIVGTFVGGYLTTGLGVGRALWLFGLLQSCAGLGYSLVASTGVNRPLMYAAMAFEAGMSGMGTGAFSVLLIRLTQKRFSATQYALFSSVFALGRTIAGPIAGALADAVGWRDFFLFTVVCGLPGLAMLQRFVPIGTRELPESLEQPEASTGSPLTRVGLLARGLVATLFGVALGAVSSATLTGLKALKEGKGFSLWPTFERLASPASVSDWVSFAGVLAFGLIVGFGTAAYFAARRGLRP
ncbi:MAG: MFS transporter [Myxococcales bacterium]